MAGQNGGARPGAGRKPKAEKYKQPINKAERRIVDRLPDLIDSLLDLATGVQVEEVGDDGEPRVYTRPPDRKAAEYLVNRIMGIPTARIEVENSGEVGVRYTADDFARARADTDEWERATFGDLDGPPAEG
jgi:hypothetical protein